MTVNIGLSVETMHEFVEVHGDCWLWQRATTPLGYGKVRFDGKCRLAHRVVYELLIGEISPGMTLDHLCRVPSCVNPDHLEPVTLAENQRRSPLVRSRTHCQFGHPMTPENVRTRADRPDSRECATCGRRRKRDASRRRRSLLRLESKTAA